MTESKAKTVKAKSTKAKVTKAPKVAKAPKKSAEQILKERNIYRKSPHYAKPRTAGGAVV
jgi:hypothetical protein